MFATFPDKVLSLIAIHVQKYTYKMQYFISINE